jgi:hypothetical protein
MVLTSPVNLLTFRKTSKFVSAVTFQRGTQEPESSSSPIVWTTTKKKKKHAQVCPSGFKDVSIYLLIDVVSVEKYIRALSSDFIIAFHWGHFGINSMASSSISFDHLT